MYSSLRLQVGLCCALALAACVEPASVSRSICVEGAVCDDGDPCTVLDRCSAGVCEPGAPMVCDATDCRAAGACNSATGLCENPAKDDGERCDDGDLCTLIDSCEAGECVGSWHLSCDALPTAACVPRYECHPDVGLCLPVVLEDGAGCDDGDVCTVDDRCGALACAGAPVVPPSNCTDGICFVDATAGSGLEHLGGYGLLMFPAGGAAIDYDGDGDLDLLLAGYDLTPTLLANDGRGVFTDVSVEAGLRALYPSRRLISAIGVADLDNDGDPDAYLGGFDHSRLLVNNSGVFSEDTRSADIAALAWASSIVFFDYDADGLLDIFLGGYAIEDATPVPNVVYRNMGDAGFEDVTSELQLSGAGATLAMLPTDFDGDGDLDLMVCNDFGQTFQSNRLYRNDGPGAPFADATDDVGMDIAIFCMGIAAGDLNRDGAPDYLFTNIGETPLWMSSPAGLRDATGSGISPRVDDHCLVDKLVGSWAAGFHDFDQDGWLDLYVSTGLINSRVAVDGPNLVYRYDGSALVERTEEADLLGIRGASRGSVFGDFDGDGDIDVVQLNLDRSPQLLRNDSPEAGHWLLIELVGRTSPRDAIGAQLEATVGGAVLLREAVPFQGHASTSDKRLHFGLSEASLVDELRIRWPSGVEQVLADVGVDQVLTVIEPDPTPAL